MLSFMAFLDIATLGQSNMFGVMVVNERISSSNILLLGVNNVKLSLISHINLTYQLFMDQ